jgi:hypothetical protein
MLLWYAIRRDGVLRLLFVKLSPEELFKKYDTDGSGNISAPEFLAMVRLKYEGWKLIRVALVTLLFAAV